MSDTISAFDAKNHLGQLLDRVESGEEITITRHGEPVALLVPHSARKGQDIAQALQTFKELRAQLSKSQKISRNSVRKWIQEGRR